MRKDVFADRFAEAAADSDYSRFSKLQTTTSHDIEAAAEALWRRLGRTAPSHAKDYLTEQAVIDTLLAQEKYYGDEDELVSAEFQEYWDATDEMKFSAFTLDSMRGELVSDFLASKRKEGYTTVSTAHGIWLFKFEREG